MNAINIIKPYWKHGTWCFTDENVGLKDEPFVAGADKMISYAIHKKGLSMEECAKGFSLTFSGEYFPDFDVVIHHDDADGYSGNYYRLESDELGTLVGWLCPALMKYFDKAPESIYAKVSSGGTKMRGGG
jgi:hypothetical protein